MTLNTAATVDSLAHQETDYKEMTHRGRFKEGTTVGGHTVS